MKTSESIAEIATALANAQGSMKPAAKDATNPHFRSRYADLSSVWDAIRGPLTRNGISVLQQATTLGPRQWTGDVLDGPAQPGVAVSTRLLHTSGQWIEFDPLTVPLSKVDAHGVGSAATYARRYALSAALGIVADEDDDGNAAVQRNGAKPVTNELPTPAKPAAFEAWIADLMAVSMTGAEPLRQAWNKSDGALRRYLTTTDPDRWERIKAVAVKVSSEAVTQ